MTFCSLPHMSPKEAPMISLLEDMQNRLDAAALLLNSTNQEAGWESVAGRVILVRQRTYKRARFAKNRAGRGGASQRRMLFKNLIYTSEFCGNSFVGAYKKPLARRAAACRVAALAAAPRSEEHTSE